MYVRGAALVIGTAQNLDIAEEVWQGAVDIAQDVPELEAEIEKYQQDERQEVPRTKYR